MARIIIQNEGVSDLPSPGKIIVFSDPSTKTLKSIDDGGIVTDYTQGGGGGSQGATGVAGANGAAGSQGITGLRGVTGASSVGTQGATGVAGVGSQGATGASAVGTQGVTGAVGIQGATGAGVGGGSQGVTGSQGIQGVTGIAGSAGSAGSQGATGVGSAGSQGVTGPGAGSQGTTGISGATGAEGLQGPMGVTGIGSQGITGTAGLQGATGTGGGGGSSGYTYKQYTPAAGVRVQLTAFGSTGDVNAIGVAWATNTITITSVSGTAQLVKATVSYDASINATTSFILTYPEINGQTTLTNSNFPIIIPYGNTGAYGTVTAITITNSSGTVSATKTGLTANNAAWFSIAF